MLVNSKIVKTLFLGSCALLFMGNKGCDSEEAIYRGRVLKKSAYVTGFESQTIKVGDQIDVDISGILLSQFHTVFNESRYFTAQNKWGDFEDGFKFNSSFGECVNDVPEALIGGTTTSFELGNEYGVKIGFGPGGSFGGTVNGEFNLKEMSFGLNLQAVQPLSWTVMSSVKDEGVKKDYGVSGGVNIGLINIGGSFVKRKPVRDVIIETFAGSLEKLGKNLNEFEPWSARVMESRDSHFRINAGLKNGLKKGDFLYVSNMDFVWSGNGKPCENPLKYQLPLQDRDNPVAIGVITSIDYQVAEARITQPQQIEVKEGARAYIYYLEGLNDGSDPLPDMPQPGEVLLN